MEINIFKNKNFKENIPHIIANECLSIFDALYIYYITIKKLKKNYFYKLDNKTHQRFWSFVNRASDSRSK